MKIIQVLIYEFYVNPTEKCPSSTFHALYSISYTLYKIMKEQKKI